MHLVDTAIKLITDSLLNCSNGLSESPTAKVFLTHLTPPYVIAIIVGSILCMMTLIIGVTHAFYISIYVTHPNRRALVSYLAGTAPFVSTFAMVSLFMPRVWFLAHLMSFFYFSNALYFVICLLMNLVEGRHTIVKKMGTKSSRLSVATPPFCCVFPCLPTPEIETRKIQFCETMVMQTPIVRLFATLVSLILFFECQDGAILALKVLDTICVPSLLAGIYGCHILVTTISKLDELVPFRYIVVFRLLDFFFMFFGMQQPIFDFLARVGVFGCGTILPPLETAFFWKNFLVIVESLIVSLISTALLKPSRSALFDKYPISTSSAASIISVSTQESTA